MIRRFGITHLYGEGITRQGNLIAAKKRKTTREGQKASLSWGGVKGAEKEKSLNQGNNSRGDTSRQMKGTEESKARGGATTLSWGGTEPPKTWNRSSTESFLQLVIGTRGESSGKWPKLCMEQDNSMGGITR